MGKVYKDPGSNKLSNTLEDGIDVLKFVKDWGVHVYREPDAVVLHVLVLRGAGDNVSKVEIMWHR